MGPVIPANINDLSSIRGTLSDMIDMALQAHHDCDIGSDTECGGEQYGDGSADEHCRLRDAEATVKLLRLAAFAPERLAAEVYASAPALLAALEDMAEQIAAYDHLHGENSCAIDDAPALAAIRDINPCYDPTSNIYPVTKATGRGRGD